ncbi:similar to Saccharomyces cerevisiae YDL239C ADY3 Protein required for spore wall formation [Maudiozyma saulgeensis]|uniref:Similar to Saccharomyces cerevisiae YDL239C ADY3 Protein required for spore wall formation n=1 Tax=Maudiozyma saulgeensis TaxID=1789683 RepID=A0A1X7R259_9SACH|nr:similar to Saccharomyces cerevisiae YDL239C ADY3 Protein required for spore wall formation [Kazachstania saulgeensis]
MGNDMKAHILEAAQMLDADSNDRVNTTTTSTYRTNNTNVLPIGSGSHERLSDQSMEKDQFSNEIHPTRYNQSTPKHEQNSNPNVQGLDGNTVRGTGVDKPVSNMETIKNKINNLQKELNARDDIIRKINDENSKLTESFDQLQNTLESKEDEIVELRRKLMNKEKESQESIQNNLIFQDNMNKLEQDKISFSKYIDQLKFSDISIGSIIIDNYKSFEQGERARIIQLTQMLSNEGIDIEEHIFKDRKTISSILDNSFDRIAETLKEFKLDDSTGIKQTLTDIKSIEENIKSSNITTQKILENIKLEFSREGEKFENLLKQKDSKIEELLSSNKDKDLRNEILEKEYQTTRGNSKDSLTYDDVKSADVTRVVFDSLELEQIDKLDMVTLQNELKKICVGIQTPFNKIQRKVILANVLIKNELVHALNFINLLYFQLHGDNLHFRELENTAYRQYLKIRDVDNVQHPLKHILDEMYQHILLEMTSDV